MLTGCHQRAFLTPLAAHISTIGFVGAGRLAASLSAALTAAGYPIRAVASRDRPSAATLASSLGTESAPADAVVRSCDFVFLTVPDSQISELARSLPWRPGQFVVHCSGALDLRALAFARDRGAIPGCFHPLQTFPSRTPEPLRFQGIHCGIEAPEPLGAYLETLAADLGALSFRLEGVDRRLYHAAAVFMSNHVVALASAAARLWELAGLDASARGALSPLMLSAANNVANMSLRDALTGPIARGDIATVRGHLAALAGTPDLRELYRALSAELLHLDLNHSPETTQLLSALLRP